MEGTGFDLPHLGIAAARASNAVGPAALYEERLAIFFGLEPGEEFVEFDSRDYMAIGEMVPSAGQSPYGITGPGWPNIRFPIRALRRGRSAAMNSYTVVDLLAKRAELAKLIVEAEENVRKLRGDLSQSRQRSGFCSPRLSFRSPFTSERGVGPATSSVANSRIFYSATFVSTMGR